MNILTVRDNLRKTIAGKEEYLARLNKLKTRELSEGGQMAIQATKSFLEININELKVILFDVEQCIPAEPEFNDNDSAEVRNLTKMGR